MLFRSNEFYTSDGVKIAKTTKEIIEKLESITGIRERRYVPFDQDSIGLMTEASRLAVADAGLDVNQLSGIIVAHNAGNMIPQPGGFHTVPNFSSIVKKCFGLY